MEKEAINRAIREATGINRDDFDSDLNAMHEAETMLTADQAIKFRLRLSENSGRRNSEFPTVEAAMCHATAHQRAEAFLRTVGKWRNG